MYGIGNDFCAPKGYGGDIRYLPKDWTGVAQWFGVTAFLFCVHSMVSSPPPPTTLLYCSLCNILNTGYSVGVGNEEAEEDAHDIGHCRSCGGRCQSAPLHSMATFSSGRKTQGMCGGALTTLYHVVRYILAMTQMVCTHNRTQERNKL